MARGDRGNCCDPPPVGFSHQNFSMDQVIQAINSIIPELVEDAKSVVSTEGGHVVAKCLRAVSE